MLVSAVDDAASGGEWVQGPVYLGPGEEGEALISLQPLGFGRWSKVLAVASNDPERPKTALRLSATIRSRFLVEPRVLDLGRLPADSDTVLVVTIAARQLEDFRLLGAELNPAPLADPTGAEERREPGSLRAVPPFTLALRPPAAAPDSGGQAWRLELRLAPDAAPGRLNERIRVQTSDPVVPSLDIAVLGELRGGLDHPERLEISGRFTGVPASGTLPIRRLSGPPFAILDAAVNDPRLRLEVLTLTAGEAYAIEVTVLPDMPRGHHSALLTVTTDRRDLPQLSIPINVRMGRAD